MTAPKVSVILTTQLDSNVQYLNLCLSSLAQSKGIDFEVWVISGAQSRPHLPPLDHFYSIWDRTLDTATKKIEFAKKCISAQSTHILHLSDDVVVTCDLISSLYHAFEGRDMIMNPMSNSDSRSLYEADVEMRNRLLLPDMSYEDFKGMDLLNEIRNFYYFPGRFQKCLVAFPQLSFYCTMIPKSVYDKVGELDPELEYRCNDVDFCYRARRIGIPSVVNFGAYAFHFGSKTLSQLDKDHTLGNEALKHFQKKWNIP